MHGLYTKLELIIIMCWFLYISLPCLHVMLQTVCIWKLLIFFWTSRFQLYVCRSVEVPECTCMLTLKLQCYADDIHTIFISAYC